ncbi:MAG: dephospho-CoA kinase [Gammaproteobacteria bacterium]|nr:dephospho-CoA kinase [Gammaproteobacteria bacterium]
MLRIGLTGGIGSGKSTVTELFKQFGVAVFDADIIARQLMEPGQTALEQVKTTFGNTIVDSTGNLDRTQLRQLIFHDAQLREKLENILHPRIRHQLLLHMKQATSPYCIAAVPLLVEKGWQTIFNRILVLDMPKTLQITRAKQRDKATEQHIRAIIATQVDRNTRLAAADDIIHNIKGLSELRLEVEKYHRQYLLLAERLGVQHK